MQPPFIAVWAACYGLCLGCAAGALWGVQAVLEAEPQMRYSAALSSAAGFLVLLALMLAAATGFLAQWLIHAYFKPLRRLAQDVRLIAGSNPALRTQADGVAAALGLAQAANLLAEQREGALKDLEARVAAAHSDLDEEKNRLAALMSELAQSVLVCNAEGRILLYNQRARELFTGNSGDPSSGMSAPAYIGLGRSLFSLIERDLFIHAVEQLEFRIAQGESRPVTTIMMPMGTARLLRARMAPVMAATNHANGVPPLAMAGYVLLLEDVSVQVAHGEQRDYLQQRLLEDTRAALATIRAAVENILNFPDALEVQRHRFAVIIDEEARRLGAELERATLAHTEFVSSHWQPELIRLVDLVQVIRRRIESQCGVTTRAADGDTDAWVHVDSYTLMLAVCHLACRLREACAIHEVRFRVSVAARHVHLDMAWTGVRLPAAMVLTWENAALGCAKGAGALTLREALQRHNGEMWYQHGPALEDSMFRILLPLAAPGRPSALHPLRNERPEYYDFDLFNPPGRTRAFDELPLQELIYTAFDTETTGLEPSAGDEIISVGGVRIVNGRLLTAETFDQLVNPQRPITPASAKIHGIRSEMLHGQPTIVPVVAAFHRFCEDTVLVGHNAAFDLRFFQLQEEATGVRFTQPLLDTLLLSAALHGDVESHTLEAIAERFGINVAGRHTALGDALLTGEIFLKMIPLLTARGIVTLRQARETSQRTFYARIHY